MSNNYIIQSQQIIFSKQISLEMQIGSTLLLLFFKAEIRGVRWTGILQNAAKKVMQTGDFHFIQDYEARGTKKEHIYCHEHELLHNTFTNSSFRNCPPNPGRWMQVWISFIKINN